MAPHSSSKLGLAKHYDNDLPAPPKKKDSRYPNHNRDPKKKDRAFILQYAKGMYSDWYRTSRNYVISSGQRARFIKYIKYAQGMQDVDLYKNLLDIDKKTDYLNLDWSIVAIIPKFMDIIIGMMQKMRYEISCDTLDPSSIDKKRQREYEMKAALSIREQLEELDRIAGVDMRTQQEKDLPQSMEELEILLEGSDYKEATEIGMEEAITWVLDKNDWPTISNKIKFYLLSCGIAATKDRVDGDGNIIVDFVDPVYLITSYSNREDFKHIRHAGEVRFMTIEEIKDVDRGKDITPEDFSKIIRYYAGNYGNAPYNVNVDFGPDYQDGYDDYRIPVMDFEFISADVSIYEEKRNPYGNSTITDRDYDYIPPAEADERYERTIHKKKIAQVYRGMWILGTNFVFDYGLAPDQKRGDSLSEAELSYHIFAPGLEKMNNKPMVEKMVPFANELMIAWYRLQNAIAKARPKGLAIEITGLMETNMPGKGGQALQPLEIIDIFDKTGNLLWKRTGDGNEFNYKPVEEIENGLGREVGQYMDIINQNIELMRQVSGINAIADASTPHPDQLIGTAKMAVTATSNAIHPIINGFETLFANTAKGVAKRIQTLMRHGGDSKKDLKEVIGSEKVRFLEITDDISMIDLGINIDVTLSEEQEARLDREIEIALQQRSTQGFGGITFEDAIAIRRFKNAKLAEKMLIVRRKKSEQEDSQKSAEAAQANADAQAQAAEQASQFKQQELAMEEEGKVLEHQRAMELLTLEYQLKSQLENTKGGIRMVQNEQDGEIKSDIESQKNVGEALDTKIETPKPKAA